MPQITIEVTEEELKAVECVVVSAQAWLEDAWKGKAHNCMKRIIIEETDRNPDRLTVEQRTQLIRDTPLKSRAEKESKEVSKKEE